MFPPDPRFDQLDELSGTEFELALVDLFGILGYREATRIGGFDKGADITFMRDGVRVAVQAKRRAGVVGIDAVRQVVDGRKRYDCVGALVVTNSFFSKQAIECAEEWDVDLWDRRVLAGFLGGDEPVVDTTLCAECGVAVTQGVTEWCLARPWRFLGSVFCMTHQKRSRRAAA